MHRQMFACPPPPPWLLHALPDVCLPAAAAAWARLVRIIKLLEVGARMAHLRNSDVLEALLKLVLSVICMLVLGAGAFYELERFQVCGVCVWGVWGEDKGLACSWVVQMNVSSDNTRWVWAGVYCNAGTRPSLETHCAGLRLPQHLPPLWS
jgi:hypothetical protein